MYTKEDKARMEVVKTALEDKQLILLGIENRIKLFQQDEKTYFIKYGMIDHAAFIKYAEEQLGI